MFAYLCATVGWLPLRAIDQSINQSNGCSKQRFRADSELRPLLNAERSVWYMLRVNWEGQP